MRLRANPLQTMEVAAAVIVLFAAVALRAAFAGRFAAEPVGCADARTGGHILNRAAEQGLAAAGILDLGGADAATLRLGGIEAVANAILAAGALAAIGVRFAGAAGEGVALIDLAADRIGGADTDATWHLAAGGRAADRGGAAAGRFSPEVAGAADPGASGIGAVADPFLAASAFAAVTVCGAGAAGIAGAFAGRVAADRARRADTAALDGAADKRVIAARPFRLGIAPAADQGPRRIFAVADAAFAAAALAAVLVGGAGVAGIGGAFAPGRIAAGHAGGADAGPAWTGVIRGATE